MQTNGAAWISGFGQQAIYHSLSKIFLFGKQTLLLFHPSILHVVHVEC